MARVLIVGAGLAGLSAAHRLVRAGHEVDVLERERRVGGRVATERRGGFIVEHGPAAIRESDRALHALAAEAGLRERALPLPPAEDRTLRAGVFHPSGWQRPRQLAASRLLSVGAKARLSRLLLEAWRGSAPTSDRLPARAASDDGDAAAALSRTYGADATELLFGPKLTADLGAEPEHVSRACLPRFLAPGEDRAIVFERGMEALPRALAEPLEVRLGWDVVSVEADDLGVQVHYVTPSGERTLRGEAAVIAVPAPGIPSLCPRLEDGERAFFEQVRMVRGLGVTLLFEKAPSFEATRFHLPRSESENVVRVEALRAPPGSAVLRVTLHPSANNRLREARDGRIIELVLEELERTPLGRLEASDAIVDRWDPMLPSFHPGAWKRLAAFHARHDRTPRIAFAGDALAGPSVDAAVQSGLRAAEELLASVASGGD